MGMEWGGVGWNGDGWGGMGLGGMGSGGVRWGGVRWGQVEWDGVGWGGAGWGGVGWGEATGVAGMGWAGVGWGGVGRDGSRLAFRQRSRGFAFIFLEPQPYVVHMRTEDYAAHRARPPTQHEQPRHEGEGGAREEEQEREQRGVRAVLPAEQAPAIGGGE